MVIDKQNESLETTLLPNVTLFCILFGSIVFEEVNNRKTVVCEAGNYACLVFGEECDLFDCYSKHQLQMFLFI